MAIFKVGQRVRIKCAMSKLNGREGRIIASRTIMFRVQDNRAGKCWHVTVDDHGPTGENGFPLTYFNDELLPLTDPKADEFIEGIKKLRPLHDPLTVGDNAAKRLIEKVSA